MVSEGGGTMAPGPNGVHQHPALSSLGDLGLQVRVLDRFCVVTEVRESTPAAESGLELGDMIEQVNGVPVKEGMDFQAGAMMALQEGTIRFRVLKGTGMFEEIEIARPQIEESVLLAQVGLWVKSEGGKMIISGVLQQSPAAYCGKCAIGDILESVAYARPYNLAELCEVAWGTVGTLLQIEVREREGSPINTIHLLRQSPAKSGAKYTHETEQAAVGVHVRSSSDGKFHVSVIEEGSPAYWSDLKVGDCISKIDGEPMRDVDQFVVQSLGVVGSRVVIMVNNKNGPASSVTLVRAPTLHDNALARAKEYRNQALEVLQKRIHYSLAKTPTKPAPLTAVDSPTLSITQAVLEEELPIVSTGPSSPQGPSSPLLPAHRADDDEDVIVAMGQPVVVVVDPASRQNLTAGHPLSTDRSGSPTYWQAPATLGTLQEADSVPSTVLPALSPPLSRRPASPIAARSRTPSPPIRRPPTAMQQGSSDSEDSAAGMAKEAVEFETPQPKSRQSPPHTLEASHQEGEASPDLIGEMDLILSHQSSRFSSFIEPPIFAASPISSREPASASRYLFHDINTDADQSGNARETSLSRPARDNDKDLPNPFRNTLPQHPSPARSWHDARPTHRSPQAPTFPTSGVAPISQEWISPPGESVALLGNSAMAAGHGPSTLLHSDDQPRSIETSIDHSSLRQHLESPAHSQHQSPPISQTPNPPSGGSQNLSDVSSSAAATGPVLIPMPPERVDRGREVSPVFSAFLANALHCGSDDHETAENYDQTHYIEHSPSSQIHSDAILGPQQSPEKGKVLPDTSRSLPDKEPEREQNMPKTDNSHSYLVAVEEEEEPEEASPVQYKLSSSLDLENEGDIEVSPPNPFRNVPFPAQDGGGSPCGTKMQKKANVTIAGSEGAKPCLSELGIEDYTEFSVDTIMQDMRTAEESQPVESTSDDEGKQKAALATMAVAILSMIHSSSKQTARDIMRLIPEKPAAAADLVVKALQESAQLPPSGGRVQAELAFDPIRFCPKSSQEDELVQNAAFLPLEPGDEIEVIRCGDRGWALGSKVTAQGVLKSGWFPWDFVSSDFKIDYGTFIGRCASRHISSKRMKLDETVVDTDSEEDTVSNLKSGVVAVALCGWQAHKPWATSLVAGQLMCVLKRSHGWIYAAEANAESGADHPDGKHGWVPARFLKVLDGSAEPTSHAGAQAEDASSAIDGVKAAEPRQPSLAHRDPISPPQQPPRAASQDLSLQEATVPNSNSLAKVFSRGATPHQPHSVSSQPRRTRKPTAEASEACRMPPGNQDTQVLGTVLNKGKATWSNVDSESPAEQRFKWTQTFSRLRMTPREVENTVSPPAASLNASRSEAARGGSEGMTKQEAWALLGQGFVDTESDEKLLYA